MDRKSENNPNDFAGKLSEGRPTVSLDKVGTTQANGSEKDDSKVACWNRAMQTAKGKSVGTELERSLRPENPALNTLMLLQAAAMLDKVDRDAASVKSATYGSPTMVKTKPTVTPPSATSLTSVSVASSNLERETLGNQFHQGSKATFPTELLKTPPKDRNDRNDIKSATCLGGASVATSYLEKDKIEHPRIRNDTQHPEMETVRDTVQNEHGGKTCTTPVENVDSCARTSPCSKTFKGSPRWRLNCSDVTDNLRIIIQANSPLATDHLTPEGEVVTHASASSDENQFKAPTSAQHFTKYNTILKDGATNVSVKGTTTSCVLSPPVSLQARGGGNTTTRVALSSSKTPSPQRKTAAPPLQPSIQTHSASFKGPVFYLYPYQIGAARAQSVTPIRMTRMKQEGNMMAYTVPALKYFTVRQQLVNLRTPSSQIMVPVQQVNPMRTSGNTNVRKEAATQLAQEITVSLPLPTNVQSNFSHLTHRATQTSHGREHHLRHQESTIQNFQIGESILAPDKMSHLMQSHVPKLTTSLPPTGWSEKSDQAVQQSPVNKQCLRPRSDLTAVNPTLNRMMKHFDYTMSHLNLFLDPRFLRKMLSDDPQDLDDVFEEVERHERMQQHPVPNWLVDFVLDNDAWKKEGKRLGRGRPSCGLQEHRLRCRNADTVLPSNTFSISGASKVPQDQNSKCRGPRSTECDTWVMSAREMGCNIKADTEGVSRQRLCNKSKNTSAEMENHETMSSSGVTRTSSSGDLSPSLWGTLGCSSDHRESAVAEQAASEGIFTKSDKTESLDLGRLDLIPDRAMWNIMCSHFPPWRKVILLDGVEVEEFFEEGSGSSETVPTQNTDDKKQNQETKTSEHRDSSRKRKKKKNKHRKGNKDHDYADYAALQEKHEPTSDKLNSDERQDDHSTQRSKTKKSESTKPKHANKATSSKKKCRGDSPKGMSVVNKEKSRKASKHVEKTKRARKDIAETESKLKTGFDPDSKLSCVTNDDAPSGPVVTSVGMSSKLPKRQQVSPKMKTKCRKHGMFAASCWRGSSSDFVDDTDDEPRVSELKKKQRKRKKSPTKSKPEKKRKSGSPNFPKRWKLRLMLKPKTKQKAKSKSKKSSNGTQDDKLKVVTNDNYKVINETNSSESTPKETVDSTTK